MRPFAFATLTLFTLSHAHAQQVTKPDVLKRQLREITKTDQTAVMRMVGNLTEDERTHLQNCYDQSHSTFWPPSFRNELLGRWIPAIRVIQILDTNQAVIDMGGFPIILEGPDVYRLNESSEFRERRLFKVVGQEKLTPSDAVGDWFALKPRQTTHVVVSEHEGQRSGTGQSTVARDVKSSGKGRANTKVAGRKRSPSGETMEVTSDNSGKSVTDTDTAYSSAGKSKSISRITHAHEKDYEAINVFVVRLETDEERGIRTGKRAKASKPSEVKIDAEAAAKSKLKLIEELMRNDRLRPTAKFRLEQLIERYPNTEAAKKAKEMLKEME